MQESAINIGLHLEGKVIDLRIPCFVDKNRLKELLEENLGDTIAFPSRWELKPLDKKIRLEEDILLKDYPLSDGDQLVVSPSN